MKKTFALLIIVMISFLLFASFDSTKSDRLFYNENDYEADFKYLEESLKEATSNDEKAEILWRMSRTRLTLTDSNKANMTKDERYAAYGDYSADDTPKDDDNSSAFYYAYQSLLLKETPNALHWKASAVGRAGQEHGPLNSLQKASPMRKLEAKALENYSDFALATDSWYVLGILYNQLPGAPISFGNNNYAISYMRKCIMTQDNTNRTNGTNYLELAEQLWARNWDSKKRDKEFKNMEKDYNKNLSKGATECNKYYEGTLNKEGGLFYVSGKLSSMSDRQEARALLQYGISFIDLRLKKTTGTLAREKMIEEKDKLSAKLKEWS